MKTVKSIDGTLLTYPMLVVDDGDANKIMSEVYMSEAGTHIIFQNEFSTFDIELATGTYSWITKSEKDSIINLYSSGSSFQIIYGDDSTQNVKFSTDKKLLFEPLDESLNLYSVRLNLIKE